MTLALEDGEWVEAQKMILAASSCLCLAENSKNKHPHPPIFMRRIQSNIQYSEYFRFLTDSKTSILSKFCPDRQRSLAFKALKEASKRALETFRAARILVRVSEISKRGFKRGPETFQG